MIRGVLRGGRRAARGIGGAAGYERQGNNGETGEDNIFHNVCLLFGCFFNHARLGQRLVKGYGV